jgi:hypothetical protein
MDLIKDIWGKYKNDTIDPLTIIIKLFICAYKPTGTKVSILNNKLIIQNSGIFQGTVRTIYRDSKNDINILFFPIIFGCKYYLSTTNKPKFINLFKKILDTFDKLKKTYQGNEIIYNIDQLKNIVTSFIETDNFDPLSLLSTYDSPGGKIKQDIYTHLNNIWTEKRLNLIFGYVDEILESTNKDYIDHLIYSLNSYMNYVDIIIVNLIINL